MNDIIPVFSSNYSLGGASVLTLDEAGKSDEGTPISICDIAKTHSLPFVTIVDDRIDGYMEAVKNIQKAKISQLEFGLKITCCADHLDKTDESLRTESKVIIMIRNRQGYYDLLKIHNLAGTDDFYHERRTSWKRLKDLWTPNLILVIPFFSGFLARNSLYMASIVPDFPIPAKDLWLFREVDSGLPFAPIIDEVLNRFAADTGARIQPIKSIYYSDSSRFKSYVITRALENRGTLAKPEVAHLSSDRFSFARWMEITKVIT